MSIPLHVFPDRPAASAAAAQDLARGLKAALEAGGDVGLAVSGGTTPAACLAELSIMPLAWQRVQVVLTDERCVPADHPARNARMVRDTLLTNNAAKARLIELSEAALETLPSPYARVLLGMGADGHFASIFPDAPNLDVALNPDSGVRCLDVRTSSSPHARITQSLAQLLRSEKILLLVFGEDKRRVIENPSGYPVEHLLNQTITPLDIFWAP